MISYRHKTVFVHIPKTAGKSIEAALEMNPDRSEIHMTLQDLVKRYGNLDKYFKFTIVRNPFDRLVSLYSYFSQISPMKKQYEGMTFKEYLFNHASRKNQIDFIVDHTGKIAVDHVGKYEQIDTTWKFVQNMIRRISGNNVPDLEIVNKSEHEYFMNYYDQEMINHVFRIYAKDFIQLQYSTKLESYVNNT